MEAVEIKKRGGAEPAVDGEGSGIVWVLGSVSVSDSRTDRKTDVSGKEQGKVFDQAEAVGVEDGRPGGGGTRRPRVSERGGMDDGLGCDDGRFRDRVAALEPEAGEDAEARRRGLVPQARGDAERGVSRPRAAGRKDASEGATAAKRFEAVVKRVAKTPSPAAKAKSEDSSET